MREDVAIRAYAAGDAPALYEAARESTSDVFPWLPWCHPRYTLEEAEGWTATRPKLFSEAVEYNFVIVDAAQRFLGGCGLNQINRDHRFANLGYWVRSSAAGQGIAPAAVRRLAAFAFGSTDLIRLEIVCAVELGERAAGTLVVEHHRVRLPGWRWLRGPAQRAWLRRLDRIWEEDLAVRVCRGGWPGVPEPDAAR